MKVYQISYDLRKKRDYSELYQRIMAYNSYCPALGTTWVVASTQTATEIRDNLRAALDPDDALLITCLAPEAAWCGLITEISHWLSQRLQSATASRIN